jgi:hypothetical protein
MGTSIRKIGVPLLIMFVALNVVGAGLANAQATEATQCTVRATVTAQEATTLTAGTLTADQPAGTVLLLSGPDAGNNSLICTFSIIKFIANILFIIILAIAVILLFYAAFLYVTAGADTARAGTARQILLYAIIGLILAAVARIIPIIVQGLIGLG